MARAPSVLITATLLVAGCATAGPESAFDEVREGVATRTGQTARSLEWSGVSAPADAVTARITTLLADEVTAEEAVQVALLNNRRLQASYAELGVAAADLAQASRLRNPVLEAAALFDEGETDLVELSLVQEFLDTLLLPLRKQLAADASEIVRLEVTRGILETVTEIRRTFYALQADVQRLELLRNVLLATEASSGMADRLYEAGNVSELDRLRQRDLMEQTRLAVAAVEMSILESRERLNRLMGLWGPVTMAWQPASRLPDIPETEIDSDDIERRVVTASLDLELASQRIEQAARRFGFESITAVVPDVGIGVAAEGERQEDRDDQDDGDLEYAVGPLAEVAIPLFDQGQPARARGRAILRGLWDEYTATAVELRSAARAAALRLRFSRQWAGYYREVVIPLRQRITHQSQLHYNAMFIGVFQLLEAKRREIDAGLGYVDAVRDYWLARADLAALEMGVMPSPGVGRPSPEEIMTTGMDAAAGGH